MSFLGIFLGVVLVIAVIVLTVLRSAHKSKVEREIAVLRRKAEDRGSYSEEQINEAMESERENRAWPIPNAVRPSLIVLAIVMFGLGLFNSIFFYAEPGFVYHVRTIAGEERVVDDLGYSYYLFGRVNAWKKAMTVQADDTGSAVANVQAENEAGANTSASLAPLTVVMLDQVDSKISATTRFRIPTDRETFLKLAHEYRTPENLLRTALIPAFKETVQATGSLMAAEEYYSGRRTEFNAEFENQMQNGIFLVERRQVVVQDETAQATGSAAADLGKNQKDFGDHAKVRWVVEKRMKEDGVTFERKVQNFIDYGITVIEARVTDLKPNQKFVERMTLKQQAAADRAIAQEKRTQEEEQRLLAIAKGDREVAEEQATAKKAQIKQTTEAETEKRLTLIGANKQLEQARIDKQTAEVQLDRDKIKAQSVKVLADAQAYEKKALLNADNALQIKIDAIVQMNKDAMDAMAKRNVPGTVIYSGSTGTLGSDSDINNIATTQLLKNLKALDLDLSVKK